VTVFLSLPKNRAFLILGSPAPSSEFSAIVPSTRIVVAPAHLAAALRHFLPAAAGSLRLVFRLPGCLSVFKHHFLDRRRLCTDHCALVCHSTPVVFDLLPHGDGTNAPAHTPAHSYAAPSSGGWCGVRDTGTGRSSKRERRPTSSKRRRQAAARLRGNIIESSTRNQSLSRRVRIQSCFATKTNCYGRIVSPNYMSSTLQSPI
jgi:hypothetical protein